MSLKNESSIQTTYVQSFISSTMMRRFYSQQVAPKMKRPGSRSTTATNSQSETSTRTATPIHLDLSSSSDKNSRGTKSAQTKITLPASSNFLMQPFHTFIHGTKVLSANVSKALECKAMEFNKKRSGLRSRVDTLNMDRSKRDVLTLAAYIPVFYFVPPLLATIPLLIQYFPDFIPSTYITQPRWLNQMQWQENRRKKACAELLKWLDAEMAKIASSEPDQDIGSAVKSGLTERDIYLAKEWKRLREHQAVDPSNRLPHPGQGPNILVPFYDLLSRHYNLFLLPAAVTHYAARIAGMSFEGLPGTRRRLVQWVDYMLKDDEMIKKGIRSGHPMTGGDSVVEMGQAWQDAELVEALETRGFLPLAAIVSEEDGTVVGPNNDVKLKFPFGETIRNNLIQGLQDHITFTTQTALSRFGSIPGADLTSEELSKLPAEVQKTIRAQLVGSRLDDKVFDAVDLGGLGILVIVGRALENSLLSE